MFVLTNSMSVMYFGTSVHSNMKNLGIPWWEKPSAFQLCGTVAWPMSGQPIG